jgi:membrane glycosyltransferase
VLLARDHMWCRGRVGQLRAAQANGLVVVSRFFPNPIQKVGDFKI